MIDRLFTLALLVCVLAGGAAAVGSELFVDRTAAAKLATASTSADRQIVQLPRVVVTGKKQAATTDVATADSPSLATTSKFVQ